MSERTVPCGNKYCMGYDTSKPSNCNTEYNRKSLHDFWKGEDCPGYKPEPTETAIIIQDGGGSEPPNNGRLK